MRGFFIYDGAYSYQFGAWVADCNKFGAPARSVERIEIHGRNGTLTIDNGRFENIVRKYRICMTGNVVETSRLLRDHLMASSGYRRLEDSFRPDYYQMARYIGPFEIDIADRKSAVGDLEFDCMPQLWLKSGEIPQEMENGGRLLNVTKQTALPLLKVYGTAGTLYVGNTIVKINSIDEYVVIDSEQQNAYKGTENCNGNIYAPEFPVLPPGETGVTWEGDIWRVIITPRWWTI